jgi:hypothetical protein
LREGEDRRRKPVRGIAGQFPSSIEADVRIIAHDGTFVIAHGGLNQQPVFRHLPQAIERQERMPEVIQDAKEEHDVERFIESFGKLVNRGLEELNLAVAQTLQIGEPETIGRIDINGHDAGGATTFSLERAPAVRGADIENTQTVQAGRDIPLIHQKGDIARPGRRHPRRKLKALMPDASTRRQELPRAFL